MPRRESLSQSDVLSVCSLDGIADAIRGHGWHRPRFVNIDGPKEEVIRRGLRIEAGEVLGRVLGEIKQAEENSAFFINTVYYSSRWC